MSINEVWVNDRLHDILGISDKYIGQYLIALAKKSSSANEYIAKLRETGTVEIDTNMVNFAKELWDRVPHKTVREKTSVIAQRQAQEAEKRNQSYALLSDSDEDEITSKPVKVRNL